MSVCLPSKRGGESRRRGVRRKKKSRERENDRQERYKTKKIRKDWTRRKVSGRKIGDGGRRKIRRQRKRKGMARSECVGEGVKGKQGKEVEGGIAGCFGLSDG